MLRINIVLLVIVCALSGCGGGSSGSKSEPTTLKSSLGALTQSSSTSSALLLTPSSLSTSTAMMSSSSDQLSVSSQGSSAPQVVVKPTKIDFTAWVGELNTVVDFESSASGMEFVRTIDERCDYLRHQDCMSADMDIIDGSTVIDSKLALGGHAYYALKNGDDVSSLLIGTDKFFDRDGAEVFVFNNKLWLVGGSQSGYKSDIWSSTDGANWKKELQQAAFPARKYHRISVFKNQLWLIGGLTDTGRANDIWSSVDGINWILRNVHAAFSARYEHTVFTFMDKLWVVGGEAGETLSDIWFSSDGIAWTKVVDSAPFGARSSMQITEFKDQLFLTGGYTTSSKNDVWVSIDGVNWSLAVEHAAFSARYSHAMHQFDSKLWLSGGYASGVGSLRDMWSSTDGLSWELASSELPETQMEHKVLPLNGELFMFGGFFRKNVWSSSDSVGWEANTTRAKIPDACRYFELGGQLYATNGTDVLWQANSLMDWSRSSIDSPVPVQSLCNLVVHKDRAYVVGGFAGAGQYRNDVWSSDDGKSWVQITSSAAFTPRTSQALVSFNGKLWAVGGNNFSQSFDQIWTSIDGVTWGQEGTFDLPTSGLVFKQLFVFKNRLWFVFNYGTIWDSARTIKAYSTGDGLTWQAEALNNLTIKNDFMIRVKAETLLLFGSDRADRSQWVSNDGKNWQLESTQAPFLMTDFFTWNEKIIAIGNPVSAGGADIDYLRHLWTADDSLHWRRAYSGQFLFSTNE
jgi:hypothetical protein